MPVNGRGWRVSLVLLAWLLSVATGHAADVAASDARRSGFNDMGRSLQAMQRDDAQNPAMLWVKDGEALWSQPAGQSGKSCASCHAVAQSSMRGVAAHYPAMDEIGKRPITLGQRINQCRDNHQQVRPFAHESQELLALEAFVGQQSRGLPLAPPDDARLEPFRVQGERLFMQRVGQLNLSCAQCHDQLAGKRLGGSPIPQAHIGTYPLYRLEWQGLGSLQRRLRGCMAGVRAEPYSYGSPEYVALELYLALRSKGMLVETPAVRP